MALYRVGNINARPLPALFHVKPEANSFGLHVTEENDIICMWLCPI